MHKLEILLKNYKIKNEFNTTEELLFNLKKSYSMFYKIKKLIKFYEINKLNNYQLLLNYFIILHREFNYKFIIQEFKKIKINKKYLLTLYYYFNFKVNEKFIDLNFYKKLNNYYQHVKNKRDLLK